MEGEHITILDLDLEASQRSHAVNRPSTPDVVNVDSLEPCMPMSVPYSYGAYCLSPLGSSDVYHGGSALPGPMDKFQNPGTMREIDFSSTRALSPCLADTRLDEKYDFDSNPSPYDLQGETAQSLYHAATGPEYDGGFKVEYATDYANNFVPEYHRPGTLAQMPVNNNHNNIWMSHDTMSDSDDSCLPESNNKENTASPRRGSKKTPKIKKGKLVGKALTPQSSSYTPKGGSRLFSAEERLDLAKYAAKHGIDEAVEHCGNIWGKLVSKKVAITALEKYKMCKRAGHLEPTVEMMQATNKFRQVDRVQMAESCRKIGPTKTAKVFSEKLGMVISESTVRGFAKKY